MTNIYILAGKSASGKDTLLKQIVDCTDAEPIISNTTRPMRPNEIDGVEYDFMDKAEFDTYEYIEQREYQTLVNGIEDTWYYGTPVENFDFNSDKTYVGILDLQGYCKLYEYIITHGIQANLRLFYVWADEKTRTERAKQRLGFDETEWNRRLQDDNLKFQSLSGLNPTLNFKCIYNFSTLEKAFEQYKKYIND